MNPFEIPLAPKWGNFIDAWTRGNISLYFFNSVFVSVTSVFLIVIISTLAGYALGKMYIPKAETIVMGFLLFSFIPGIAIYITLFTIQSRFGLNATHLGLILPYTAWHLPFSIYILKKFFESVPMDIIESARIDGCGELKTFWYVVLPLIKPGVASVTVFAYISCWGELMWVQIVSSANVLLQTLPYGLLNFQDDMGVDWGPYAAGLCLVTIPLMIIFAYFQKYFISGLTQGAVKG
jgi:raffinose/stachyose/melibiose transport system permease protein